MEYRTQGWEDNGIGGIRVSQGGCACRRNGAGEGAWKKGGDGEL